MLRGHRFVDDWGNEREIDKRLEAGDKSAVSDFFEATAEALTEARRNWDEDHGFV